MTVRALGEITAERGGKRFDHGVGRVVVDKALGVEHVARRERRALEHNGAHGGVAEALDSRVLLAETDAARQEHDRRVELQTAEIEL